jgi:pyridoxal phosphate enzyme (YggS family)
MEHSQNP